MKPLLYQGSGETSLSNMPEKESARVTEEIKFCRIMLGLAVHINSDQRSKSLSVVSWYRATEENKSCCIMPGLVAHIVSDQTKKSKSQSI